MSNLVTTFKELDTRWPGFLRFLKTANGYDAEFSYDEMMSLNETMIADEEGMGIFLKGIMGVMNGQIAPEEVTFFEEHGLFKREIVELREKIDALQVQASAENATEEDLEALRKPLENLRQLHRSMMSQSHVDFVRGLEQMKIVS